MTPIHGICQKWQWQTRGMIDSCGNGSAEARFHWTGSKPQIHWFSG